ncbi:polysaccharide deacetylase [Paenibacillus chitinolyticus]|uniref:NUDIX hydrolase N-terminal domain-containing protein n=1 Tax=Paenibacillus chitinolyticus TaxID=79263 RepID=A0A410WT46_9BACL|nr:NUDIX hydrolase N-terminal domain-containing protein [Paenibacillus chitinolyticus]MCY9588677.1 NUDIX hydrolase N-terminal domain-containing protein [Paenibacillus chitinolyticus]MCY9595819.1 NUDIX hydrolase N-terminal domain-containing protein [Paenibacillus chitinolyticus]QAV17569.1 polysaccharide deacetylase [Paenibacillus chitinolyticus]
MEANKIVDWAHYIFVSAKAGLTYASDSCDLKRYEVIKGVAQEMLSLYTEPHEDLPRRVPNGENKIYLTFDDGPDPVYTPQILDLLKKYGITSTFFLMGERVRKHPHIVKRIVDEGHAIGNHTYTHPFMILLNEKELNEELSLTDEAIRDAVGFAPVLFRPPYGLLNQGTIDLLRARGYEIMMWSEELEMYDWSFPGVDNMVRLIEEKTESGSMILLHDGGGTREETVRTLDKVIPLLLERGFHFAADYLEQSGNEHGRTAAETVR